VRELPDIQALLHSRSVFIFDFDGVLVDSVDIKTQAFAVLFSDYGKSVQDKVVAYHEANKGISRFVKLSHYHRNLLSESVGDDFLDARAREFSDIVVDRVVNAAEIPGADVFLKSWSKSRRCFVVSATPADEIKDIVQRRGWSTHFEAVYGSPDSKLDNLRRLFNEFSVRPESCVFFGDASADRDAALAAGCDFIAVNYVEGDPGAMPSVPNLQSLNS